MYLQLPVDQSISPKRLLNQDNSRQNRFRIRARSDIQKPVPDLHAGPGLRSLRKGRNLYRPVLKRLIDVVGASTLLVILAPLFGLLFALVSMDGGPTIYRHRRVGRRGRSFNCLKFRTMRVDAAEILAEILQNDPERAAEWRAGFKLCDDPRVTKVGGVLRTSSLDELPQLINVLRGEMSLVGWRPMPRDEFRVYVGALRAHGRRPRDIISHHPGLSGLWQVSGRNDLTYPERVALDIEYVDRVTFWRDLRILLLTVRAVAGKSGM